MAFLLGIAGMQLLPALPGPGWLLLLAPLAWLAHRQTLLLPVLCLALGSAWAGIVAGQLLQQTLPLALEKKTIEVVGTVTSLPLQRKNSTRFEFRIEQALHNGRPVTVPRRVRLSSYAYPPARPWRPASGSRWRLRVRLKNPHGFQNPGGFDYEAHLFANRIRATGYVYGKSAPVSLGQGGWQFGANRIRESISKNIRETLGDNDQFGVITALAVGDRQGLTGDDWLLLQRTGTAHLVAISGLHLTLVSALVFFIGRFAWALNEYACKRVPAQKVAAVLALVSATAYAALAGFAIPTQRALIMLAVIYLALVRSRQPLRSSVLATAIVAVLVYDPLSVLSPGFWLSFAAVTIILFITTTRDAGRKWVQSARLQLAISIGMIPLTLLFFQNASLVAPLANLLAIPVYGLLVVPLTLVAVILPKALAGGMLELAAWISSLGWSWFQVLDQSFPTHVRLGNPGPIASVLAMAGLALLALPTGSPVRWFGICWCLPLIWVPAPPATGEFRATLLDVGQGLSLLVQTRNHALLYDTGPRFSDSFDAGDAVVVPFLRQSGIRYLDTLIVSHGDNDHIGGLDSIRNQIRIGRLMSNAGRAGGEHPCLAGQHWTWDNVEFDILHPEVHPTRKNNNYSCVLRIAGRSIRLLVPGDIERAAEQQLISRYPDGLRADYLVAPHHGSRTSSSTEFIRAVGPAWILIPAGHLNRYRHPSTQVTDRYDRLGIPWRVSGRSGAITITDGNAPERPLLYRESRQRYWHASAAKK